MHRIIIIVSFILIWVNIFKYWAYENFTMLADSRGNNNFYLVVDLAWQCQ